jgi:hypothetical protein
VQLRGEHGVQRIGRLVLVEVGMDAAVPHERLDDLPVGLVPALLALLEDAAHLLVGAW